MTAFEETSYSTAEAFLSTVVVVDNMAAYVQADEVVLVEEPDDLASVPANAPVVEAALPHSDGKLDAGVLGAAFAELGLVCGILRPQPLDQKKDAIRQAAKSADIVVLDWQMDGDGQGDGDFATALIKEMLEADEGAGGRLRLVAVYTGYTLTAVSEKLSEALDGFAQSEDRRAFEKGSSRVIVLAKDSQPNAVGEGALGVSEQDLPKRLVSEFAKFTGGLLPNATLAAIAGVRRHTHRMLGRFTKDLDGPFLTHRAILESPEDAEQFASDLIMAELDAQVPIDKIVGDKLGQAAVKEYIEHRMGTGLTPGLMQDAAGNNIWNLTLDEACNVIENGVKGLPNGVQIGKAKLYDRLYRLADGDVEQSRKNHIVFAQRARMKRDAATVGLANPPLPALRLGTVLASRKAFWVCLTPLCDSGRLNPDGDRLLFAELTRSDDKFDFVVPDGEKHVRLALEKKRTNLASFRFIPGPERVVRVQVSGENLVCSSVTDSPAGTRKTTFRWLGELKSMHAQKTVQALSANLARVGVDDFEWHRNQMNGDD